MALTLETESTAELDYLVTLEYDNDVLEIWEQPEAVDVSYPDMSGRLHRCTYTPDFLVIRKGAIEVIQVKTECECRALAEGPSQRWEKMGGKYVDLAAEHAFGAMGLPHRVVTSDETPRVLAENLRLLMQSRSWVPTDKAQRDLLLRIRDVLSNSPCITLGALAKRMSLIDQTPLLRLIDEGELQCLIREQRLAEVDDCLVATSVDLLKDALKISRSWSFERACGGLSKERAPTMGETVVVAARLRELGESAAPKRGRSRRRWKAKLKAANGDVLSLVPLHAKKGNRKRRLTVETIALMHEAIVQYILIPGPSKLAVAYRGYVTLCKQANEAGRPAVVASENTFRSEVSRLSAETVAQVQGGRRSFNAVAAPVDPTKRTLQPLRAFEKAHIDHYECDQHVVIGQRQGKAVTRRLWLTVMIDQATSAVLAISISTKSPSRMSCSAVIRECVRWHGRLPESIVVDNGSDFQSVYFEVLLARYAVTKIDRPPEDPRFGGKMEATFRNAKCELLSALSGNTSNDERGRSVSPTHRGQATAVWPVDEIYTAYLDYFYGTYNLRLASTAICSISELLKKSMERFSCSGRIVEFDDQFIIATAVPNGPLKVSRQGIRTRETWFWHPDLAKIPIGHRVETLIEPFDDGCIYALVEDKWIVCLSGRASIHGAKTIREVLQSILSIESQPDRKAGKRDYQVELGENVHTAKRKETNFTKEVSKTVPERPATDGETRRARSPAAPYMTHHPSWMKRASPVRN
jgi:transposase InsO family protein